MKDYFIKKLVFSNNIWFRTSRHLLFWAVILFYFSGFLELGERYSDELRYNLLFLPTDILATYILIYLIYPVFLKEKVINVLLGILYSVLLIVLNFLLSNFIELTAKKYVDQEYPFITKMMMSTRVMLIIFFSASFIKTIKYWYKTEINYRELEKKNTENKMALLTSQLHPHFLFNTLNNLYTLSIEKSEKVPEMILGLSSTMRYITDNQMSKVELSKEIDIIRSYINIEKIRYDNNLNIDFNVKVSESDLKSIQIPPLLIFTFIENAFKHGVSVSLDNPWMSILIMMKNNILMIHIENSVDEYSKKKSKREGVGLKNVQKRLELYYPKRAKYSINKLFDRFIVDLEIKLQTNENELFNS